MELVELKNGKFAIRKKTFLGKWVYWFRLPGYLGWKKWNIEDVHFFQYNTWDEASVDLDILSDDFIKQIR